MLSIVAFTVAILSFIFQLLIAGAQERSSREQFNNATTVNAQTQSALAELRMLTGEIQRRRDDQYETVLSHVLPSAITDAVGDDPANEQLAELLTGRLTVALRTAMQEGGSDDGPARPSPAARLQVWAKAKDWMHERGIAVDGTVSRAREYINQLEPDEIERVLFNDEEFERSMRIATRFRDKN